MKRLKTIAGLSLLELLITLSIVLFLAVIAVPSFSQQRDALSLREASMRVTQLLKQARQMAITKRQDTFVVFTSGPDWCVAVSIDPHCVCGLTCQVDKPNMIVTQQKTPATLINTQFAGGHYLRFDGTHGMSIGHAGQFIFAAATQRVRVILSNLGRVRICAENSSIWGLQQCA